MQLPGSMSTIEHNFICNIYACYIYITLILVYNPHSTLLAKCKITWFAVMTSHIKPYVQAVDAWATLHSNMYTKTVYYFILSINNLFVIMKVRIIGN